MRTAEKQGMLASGSLFIVKSRTKCQVLFIILYILRNSIFDICGETEMKDEQNDLRSRYLISIYIEMKPDSDINSKLQF